MLTLFLGDRGYLGPVGDDIPSLIPIVVALVIFFSAFTFTLNEFNSRGQSFNADRDVLIIANALKGDSYIASYPEFGRACAGLRVRGLNYVAGLVESSRWHSMSQQAAAQPDQPILSFIADAFHTENNQEFSCLGGIQAPLTQGGLASLLLDNQHIVLSFPVALELSTAVVPATLVVIAWRV
ncbi:MAG: hypothetical protein Q8P05_03250 [Candidatus Diapherotrites archaeon]|nr:hypothetical protein [Candidatus Diapherotrites archaeon]MDZ4256501.1 hypothetical protein [archaeon]